MQVSGATTVRPQAHSPLLSREGTCDYSGIAIELSDRPTIVAGATPSEKSRTIEVFLLLEIQIAGK